MAMSVTLQAPDGSTFSERQVGRGDFGITDPAFGRQQFRVSDIDDVPEMLQLLSLGQNPLIIEVKGPEGSWEPEEILEKGQETALHIGQRFYLASRKDTTVFTVIAVAPHSSSVQEPVSGGEDEGLLRPSKRAKRGTEADAAGTSKIHHEEEDSARLRSVPSSSAHRAHVPAVAGPSVAQEDARANRVDLNDAHGLHAAPFSLLAVRGIPDWANRPPMGMRLRHVVCGAMKWALISNYMIDLGWLLSACPDLLSAGKLVVVHGERGPETVALMRQHALEAGLQDRVAIHAPPLPIPYGTHHSKAFLLEYEGGLRLVVHTANLIYPDNNNKTQGLWCQDFPPKDAESPSTTDFEEVLSDYVAALGLPAEIQKHALNLCHAHDFSSARAHLITSRPGYHKGRDKDRFGHARLRDVLRRVTFDSVFQKSSYSAQFSSLGSLDEAWVNSEFLDSMAAEKDYQQQSAERRKEVLVVAGSSMQFGVKRGKLQLIWPTVEEVQNSLEGWQAGHSIPGFRKNVQKPFLQSQWHRIGGEAAGRQRAMPHIKTFVRYCEVPGVGARLAYILLTSSNLSMAAWGKLQMNGNQIFIRSYEMGVLLMPRLEDAYCKHRHYGFACSAASSPGQEGSAASEVEFWHIDTAGKHTADPLAVRRIFVPLPYRLRPIPYGPSDQPWMADGAFAGLDSCGRRMGAPGPPFYGNTESDFEGDHA